MCVFQLVQNEEGRHILDHLEWIDVDCRSCSQVRVTIVGFRKNHCLDKKLRSLLGEKSLHNTINTTMFLTFYQLIRCQGENLF